MVFSSSVLGCTSTLWMPNLVRFSRHLPVTEVRHFPLFILPIFCCLFSLSSLITRRFGITAHLYILSFFILYWSSIWARIRIQFLLLLLLLFIFHFYLYFVIRNCFWKEKSTLCAISDLFLPFGIFFSSLTASVVDLLIIPYSAAEVQTIARRRLQVPLRKEWTSNSGLYLRPFIDLFILSPFPLSINNGCLQCVWEGWNWKKNSLSFGVLLWTVSDSMMIQSSYVYPEEYTTFLNDDPELSWIREFVSSIYLSSPLTHSMLRSPCLFYFLACDRCTFFFFFLHNSSNPDRAIDMFGRGWMRVEMQKCAILVRNFFFLWEMENNTEEYTCDNVFIFFFRFPHFLAGVDILGCYGWWAATRGRFEIIVSHWHY